MIDFKDMSTDEILDELAALVPGLDMAGFRTAAGRTGSPAALASAWMKEYGPDLEENELFDLVNELWKRELKDLKSVEALSDEITEIISEYEISRSKKEKHFLLLIFNKIQSFLAALKDNKGILDKTLFDAVKKSSGEEIEIFFSKIQAQMEKTGLIEEPNELAKWSADREVPVVEAAPVPVSSEQTEPAAAENSVTDTEPAAPAPMPVKTYRRPGRKIGRNERCPCGSGKKYKKCCLGKQVPA